MHDAQQQQGRGGMEAIAMGAPALKSIVGFSHRALHQTPSRVVWPNQLPTLRAGAAQRPLACH